MTYIDFLSVVHKSTRRDYLARVNDPDYPKAKAADLAKKWGYDYWDGDRRIKYGGYRYILELPEEVIALTGSKSKVVFKPLPSDDPVQRQPNIELARRVIEWEPLVPLESELASRRRRNRIWILQRID